MPASDHTRAHGRDEAARLQALDQFDILDTLPEQTYDDITELASFLCDTPIALISFVAADRQWFKSNRGLGSRETPLSQSFCASTLATASTLIVEDARLDSRFEHNPLVLGEPNIRFYAGAPIVEAGGHVLGTVCVIDSQPRVLSPRQISALEALARQVVALLAERKSSADLRRETARLAEAQTAISQSREQLALAADAADLAAWFYDPQRNVVCGDEKMAALFGMSSLETPAPLWLQVVHIEDRERIRQEFTAGLKGAPCETEYRVVTPNSIRWVRSKARLFREGESPRLVGICEDITARKQIEETLRSVAERLQLAQSAGSITTWEWNLATGHLSWGEGSAGIYGRPASEISHIDQIFPYLHPEDLARVQQALQPALEGTGDFSAEFRIVWPDGSIHWTHGSGRPLPSGSTRPTYLVGLNMDITNRKSSEEALIRNEKLAAVGRLASSIAHEINNPLEAVTNLLYLARTSHDMDDIRALLHTADLELRRTSAIASQTLRFHKQSTSPVAVTCEDLLGSVLLIQQSRLANARIHLEQRLRSATPVLCFDGEIRQVLNNLVANAIDAMHATGGRLLLRSRNGHDWRTGRPGLILSVADTGAGMTRDTQRKIYEAFFTTKGIGGTGLGLWISCEIINRHNGQLRVRSSQAPGHSGSAFTLFLPFQATLR